MKRLATDDATHDSAIETLPQRSGQGTNQSNPLDNKILCCRCQGMPFRSVEELIDAAIADWTKLCGPPPVFDNPMFRQTLKARLTRAFTLPRKAGRPPEEYISKAVELRLQGVQWRRICLAVIDGYAQHDAATRTLERIKLQHAVRARLKGRNN